MSSELRELPYHDHLIDLHRLDPERYPIVLSSTASDIQNQNARYDIVMAFPQQRLKLDHELRIHGPVNIEDDFLKSFDHWFAGSRTVEPPQDLPFTGGWFMYCSYELAQQIEPRLSLPIDVGQTVAEAIRIPVAIVSDHQQGRTTLIAEAGFTHALDAIELDLANTADLADDATPVALSIDESSVDPYLQQVDRIKQYIYDGDIFQANLSRSWNVRVDEDCDNATLFRSLASSNPSSFACLYSSDEDCIISSSPERLVSIHGDRVQTRPIAGTRPRSDDHDTDTSLSEELLAHPKEIAEHIMLIDLERNDLGRVCEPGTIEVDELLTLESWQHVHHIVSNISGRLRENVGPGDVLRAVFPGGTITGCPKVRCMEILAEQEQEARACYTGSAGYINLDGSMDMNILIRTMYRSADTVTFRAGGGIVADSDPLSELAETRAKAKGMLAVFEGDTA